MTRCTWRFYVVVFTRSPCSSNGVTSSVTRRQSRGHLSSNVPKRALQRIQWKNVVHFGSPYPSRLTRRPCTGRRKPPYLENDPGNAKKKQTKMPLYRCSDSITYIYIYIVELIASSATILFQFYLSTVIYLAYESQHTCLYNGLHLMSHAMSTKPVQSLLLDKRFIFSEPLLVHTII